MTAEKLKATSDNNSALARFTKYIRVRSEPNSRFVEFDFAIDDPELFVELILPKQAFKNFCEKNAVVMMSHEQMAAIDKDASKWRYGDETLLANQLQRDFQ